MKSQKVSVQHDRIPVSSGTLLGPVMSINMAPRDVRVEYFVLSSAAGLFLFRTPWQRELTEAKDLAILDGLSYALCLLEPLPDLERAHDALVSCVCRDMLAVATYEQGGSSSEGPPTREDGYLDLSATWHNACDDRTYTLASLYESLETFLDLEFAGLAERTVLAALRAVRSDIAQGRLDGEHWVGDACCFTGSLCRALDRTVDEFVYGVPIGQHKLFEAYLLDIQPGTTPAGSARLAVFVRLLSRYQLVMLERKYSAIAVRYARYSFERGHGVRPELLSHLQALVQEVVMGLRRVLRLNVPLDREIARLEGILAFLDEFSETPTASRHKTRSIVSGALQALNEIRV